MYISLILFLITTCECYKILCLFPYPGKSHHMVFEPLISELAERGHNVTTVSFFPSTNHQPNRRDVSLVGLAELNIEVVDLSTIEDSYFGDFISHIPVITHLAKSNLALCEKLLYSDQLKEFIDAEEKYDVILLEHFNSDCMLGLVYNYGAPSIGLSSCAVLPWTASRLGAPDNPSYVPGMTLPVTDKMSFYERLQNMIVHQFYMWWYEIAIRWKEQRLLENRFGRTLPLLREVAENTSVLLVNTHHTLNGPRVMPPAFVEVGGIHLHNRTVQPLPEDLEKWVSGAKDGFIVFSFGSLIRGSSFPLKRLNAILKVFTSLSQRIVWKWEDEGFENLPQNVRLLRWLPQFDLLHHPNCVGFITHAGLLSLTEAVSAGVPTVAVAVLGDQFGNAAHAEDAGGSYKLAFSELDEERFGRAVRTILSEEKRAEAKLLSRKWKERPLSPMDTAILYIEQTARYGGLRMSSNARNLNILQIALLDVIAFIVCVIGIIFASISTLLRCRKRTLKVKTS